MLNVNRYIGEAESNIRNLFKDAELEWKEKLVKFKYTALLDSTWRYHLLAFLSLSLPS
jgi:hypothetical protein